MDVYGLREHEYLAGLEDSMNGHDEEFVCLECNTPLDEIEYGQLICPKCGEDYMSADHYFECRGEMYFDGERWQLNPMEAQS